MDTGLKGKTVLITGQCYLVNGGMYFQ